MKIEFNSLLEYYTKRKIIDLQSLASGRKRKQYKSELKITKHKMKKLRRRLCNPTPNDQLYKPGNKWFNAEPKY